MGTRHLAWALTENGQLLKCGSVRNPISDLTDRGFNTQKLRFLKEVREIMSQVGPGDFVLAERFQMRAFNPGAQIELVSVMLGMLAACSTTAFYPITAATWKNHMLRKYSENTMEAFFNDSYDEHQCDAIGIGLYYYEKETGKDAKFLKKFLPLQKSCRRCWLKYHGCKWWDLCQKFAEVDKHVKCVKCRRVNECTEFCKTEFKSKSRKPIINRASFGCIKFEGAGK